MKGPAQESDGGEALRNKLSMDAPKEVGTAPSGRTAETLEPWKRKTRRQVFESGAERRGLALTPDRIPELPIAVPTAQTFPAVMGVAGVLFMTATVAGVMGYLSGFRPSIDTLQPDLASHQSDVLQARWNPTANPEVSKINPEQPAMRSVAIAPASVDAGSAVNDRTSSLSAARPLAPSEPVLPRTASRPPAPATDKPKIVGNAPPPALPVRLQPPRPGIRTPAYWVYSDDGYYYRVPRTWMRLPQEGPPWTPGYWTWDDRVYAWKAGPWGQRIGYYYGSINYGFDYFGHAFGFWRRDVSTYKLGSFRRIGIFRCRQLTSVRRCAENAP
jgi:WXXGXW repeat (2 copies)